MNKKKVILIFCSAIGLFAVGFACIFTAAGLEDGDVQPWVRNAIGFSAFPFLIASIIILLVNYKKILLWEIEQKEKKLQQKGADIISANVDMQSLERIFCQNGYLKTDKYDYEERYRYLHRKNTGSGIHYYAGIREMQKSIPDSVDSMIDEMEQISQEYSKPADADSLILVFFTEELTEEDKETMLQTNIAYSLLNEAVMNRGGSLLLVCYERKTKSFYLDSLGGKFSLNPHDKAIRHFKKLLENSKI